MSVTAAPKGIVATFRPFRGQGHQHIRASLAIDARGLRGGPSEQPLLCRLMESGLARMDPLGLGLEVSPDSALISAKGTASGRISAIGPVSRAAFWEITAIPDIRDQAALLAKRIIGADHPDRSDDHHRTRQDVVLMARYRFRDA